MELTKNHLYRYADVLLWGIKTARKERYKKGDTILIRFDLAGIELAEILQGKILELGMNPIMRLGMTVKMDQNFFELSDNRQLEFIAPGQKELYEGLNGSIFINAPESLTHLAHIDPKKIGRTAIAMKPMRDILWKREEKGKFGWTLCMMPTPELARQAGLSSRDYASQIIKACYLNKKDPVAEWKSIFNNALKIKRWLNRLEVDYFSIKSKNIDLKITPGHNRRWVGISGHNIPSFELFLSPDWRGTEGVYYADQPSFRNGNYVEKVSLEFKNGRVVQSKAGKGEEFLRKQLFMDKGAGQVGEFSLTDIRFSKINRFMANTLFDENYGGRVGNCHLAVGSSYSDTFDGDPAGLTRKKKEELGFNDSALHWDLVNTEQKKVTAHLKNGRELAIYEKGMFCIPEKI